MANVKATGKAVPAAKGKVINTKAVNNKTMTTAKPMASVKPTAKVMPAVNTKPIVNGKPAANFKIADSSKTPRVQAVKQCTVSKPVVANKPKTNIVANATPSAVPISKEKSTKSVPAQK